MGYFRIWPKNWRNIQENCSYFNIAGKSSEELRDSSWWSLPAYANKLSLGGTRAQSHWRNLMCPHIPVELPPPHSGEDFTSIWPISVLVRSKNKERTKKTQRTFLQMCWCVYYNVMIKPETNTLLQHLKFYWKCIYFPRLQSSIQGSSVCFDSVSPSQTGCNSRLLHKPLHISWRKFLSIFLILFLWSHAFVVAEVCFRSLSSWMMKILIKFSSAGP